MRREDPVESSTRAVPQTSATAWVRATCASELEPALWCGARMLSGPRGGPP